MSSSTSAAAISPLSPATGSFSFPGDYHFPPFFTKQPNSGTYRAQTRTWAGLILDYCRHHRQWKLALGEAVDSELFWNRRLNRRLALADARDMLEALRADGRAEWVGDERDVAWIWWRTPEEWAQLIADWVDDTAQKNTVLTLYELTESDATRSQEFHGMDPEVLQKALNVLVKRGKAQVFGHEDQQGVKFF